jgi:hypothetical protein
MKQALALVLLVFGSFGAFAEDKLENDLKTIKELFEQGLISNELYQEKQRELLDKNLSISTEKTSSCEGDKVSAWTNCNGSGKYLGNLFYGDWINGKPNGYGIIIRDFQEKSCPNYLCKYTLSGYWQEGKYVAGFGIKTFFLANSNNKIEIRFEGEIKTASLDDLVRIFNKSTEEVKKWIDESDKSIEFAAGKGKLYTNGDLYLEGSFKEGPVIFGIGKKFDRATGNLDAIGQFREGFLDGYVQTFLNNKLFFSGTYKNGETHGKGKILMPDGGWREGVWKKGKFMDGFSYYADGLIIHHKNGEVISSNYSNNAFDNEISKELLSLSSILLEGNKPKNKKTNDGKTIFENFSSVLTVPRDRTCPLEGTRLINQDVRGRNRICYYQ